MKINTFLIGAPKCGTTSICNILNRHPDVFVVPGKEPRFFSHDQKYSNGINYFESLFNSKNDESILVDGSTTYSEALLDRYIKSAKRIYKYNKNAKIIYCVRNPINRIESQWLNMQFSHNAGFDLSRNGINFSGDFNQDIRANPEIYYTCNYWKIFNLYSYYFHEKNVKVIFFEDFIQNQIFTVSNICQFLKINNFFLEKKQIQEKANTSFNKQLYNPTGKMLLKVPKYHVIAENTPTWLRDIVKRVTKQKYKVRRPEWKTSVLREVIDYLKPDNTKFLDYMKKSQKYWPELYEQY